MPNCECYPVAEVESDGQFKQAVVICYVSDFFLLYDVTQSVYV